MGIGDPLGHAAHNKRENHCSGSIADRMGQSHQEAVSSGVLILCQRLVEVAETLSDEANTRGTGAQPVPL
jgi:hypothetical protein